MRSQKGEHEVTKGRQHTKSKVHTHARTRTADKPTRCTKIQSNQETSNKKQGVKLIVPVLVLSKYVHKLKGSVKQRNNLCINSKAQSKVGRQVGR